MTHNKEPPEAGGLPSERQHEVCGVRLTVFCTATPVIATTAPLCWIADLWLPGNIKHIVETLTETLRENT